MPKYLAHGVLSCIFMILGFPQPTDEEEDEDEFSPDAIQLNLTPQRERNAVKRNDSYCVAVNKSQSSDKIYSPLSARNRIEIRPSPLAASRERVQIRSQQNSSLISSSTPVAPRSVYAILSEGVTSSTPTTIYVPGERPTSTVAVPTPPVGSTKGTPSRYGATPPQPPQRWDSAMDTSVEYRLIQQLQSAESEGPNGPKITLPPPPQFMEEPDEGEVPGKGPPSYEEALVHSRKSSRPSESLSSDGSKSTKEDPRSWSLENLEDDSAFVPESPLPDDSPFSREGFGRQSMSEKRGRGTLDAKQSEFYLKREQQRSNESVNCKLNAI